MFVWNNYGFEDEYELCIEYCTNLTILGEGAQILTEPRFANVLYFSNCEKIAIRGVTVGHTEAADACEGGVIMLNSCNDVLIDGCSLYGCGTDGVDALDCSGVSVLNTEIHHCSSCGIYANNASNLTVSGCSFHDCTEYGALAPFYFFDIFGGKIENCEIYNNRYSNLLCGDRFTDVSFSGLNIHDNHFSAVFQCGYGASFSGIKMENNACDCWIGDWYSQQVYLDGRVCSNEDLTAIWPGQLSSDGIGAAESEYRSISREGTKEVHVTTADELIAAIASDTTVYIDVPQIDLTSASGYGEGGDAYEWSYLPKFRGKTSAWLTVYDGYQLCIGNVTNFHIVGGEIITSPRYANVLAYYDCDHISLEGVTLGHSPEEGSCAGGVLYFSNCSSVIAEGCDLYGCGIFGVQTEYVNDLAVQNTVIHDCSQGAGQFRISNGVAFLGCSVVNCPEPHFTLDGCDSFSWESKLMDPYSCFNVG